MALRIRNWTHFQHYKDRRPPWVKLHREILDDPDWHELPGESAKLLISLWLIASETNDGTLPPLRKLAFRLRMTEKAVQQHVRKLSQWLEQDDSTVLSDCLQVAVPETETETETERETEGESTPQPPEKDTKPTGIPRVSDLPHGTRFVIAFNAFEEMRRKSRAAYTDKARDLILGKLRDVSESVAVKMLENSIENGWKSVYPLKADEHRRTCDELAPVLLPGEVAE